METNQIQRMRPGCGVEGCLFAAVALFVVLLVAMLVIGFFRFRQAPVPRVMGEGAGHEVASLDGRGIGDAAGSRARLAVTFCAGNASAGAPS